MPRCLSMRDAISICNCRPIYESCPGKSCSRAMCESVGYGTNADFAPPLLSPTPHPQPPPSIQGGLWSWGTNGYGRLGLNDPHDRKRPCKVPTLAVCLHVRASVRALCL